MRIGLTIFLKRIKYILVKRRKLYFICYINVASPAHIIKKSKSSSWTRDEKIRFLPKKKKEKSIL